MSILQPSGRRHRPLLQLTLARIREFGREPEAVFWTFFFPVVLAFALGLAFRSRGPEPVFVAVLGAPGADSIVRLLERTPGLHARVLPEDSVTSALRRGDVALVLSRDAAGYRFRFDPTRPENHLARMVTEDALQLAAGRTDPVTIAADHVQERGSRYIDFLFPGLIGLNLMSTGLWSVGNTVVQMRKEQLLKRLLSTPLRRTDFLFSFLFARLFFLVAELTVILLFAVFVFGVPIRGPLAALLFVAGLGGFAFAAIGLLIGSRSRTTEGVQGLMNLASVPMWVLSGVFFSSKNFPDAIQPLIAALPLTAAVDAMRAIMLEGASLAGVAGEVAILAAWGALSVAIALPLFRWR